MASKQEIKSLMDEEAEKGNEPPVTEVGEDHPLSILASNEGSAEKRKRKAADILTKNILHDMEIYSIIDDNTDEIWTYKDGVYVPNGQTRIKKYIENRVKRAYTKRFAQRVISRISVRDETLIEKEDFFNPSKDRICLENGIYDLSTQQLEKHDPDEIHFQKIPVTYDEDAECPKINEFFDDVLGSEDDIKTIKELFAFCLRKEYFLEKAFMFLGDGRNGKGKTLDILRAFLGQDNCADIELQELGDDNKSIKLQHSLANVSGDISDKGLRYTNKLKKFTGRDLVTLDRKYKSPISFVPYAKQIFSANNIPRTNDHSLAFFDRWIMVEFPYEFVDEKKWENASEEEREQEMYKKRDPDIVDKVVSDEELSGLFNEAVSAYQRLVERGRFTESEQAEQTRIRWIRNSDSLQAFMLDEPFEVSNSRFVTKSDVKQAYRDYCDRHGLQAERNPAVKSAIQDHYNADQGQKRIHDSKPRVYYGIKFKDEFEGVSGTIDGLSAYQGSIEPSEDDPDGSERFEAEEESINEELSFEHGEKIYAEDYEYEFEGSKLVRKGALLDTGPQEFEVLQPDVVEEVLG